MRKKEGDIASLPAQLKFDVYPATQNCVDRGANEGDALGTFDEVEAGDIYRMRKDASALTLAMRDDADGTHLVAEGSKLGRAGDKLTIAACQQLMTPDGNLAEAILATAAPDLSPELRTALELDALALARAGGDPAKALYEASLGSKKRPNP